MWALDRLGLSLEIRDRAIMAGEGNRPLSSELLDDMQAIFETSDARPG